MFYFNFLVYNINFHVYFWLLLSNKGISRALRKKGHIDKNDPPPPLPAPEVLQELRDLLR